MKPRNAPTAQHAKAHSKPAQRAAFLLFVPLAMRALDDSDSGAAAAPAAAGDVVAAGAVPVPLVVPFAVPIPFVAPVSFVAPAAAGAPVPGPAPAVVTDALPAPDLAAAVSFDAAAAPGAGNAAGSATSIEKTRNSPPKHSVMAMASRT
jgi:hypothetical protein